MRLDHLNVGGVNVEAVVNVAFQAFLRLGAGRGDAVRIAVLVDAAAANHAVDVVAIPIFQGVLEVINLAKDFSPIDSLSTGRSVTWADLGRAFGQIVLLLGGGIGLVGIIFFSRRELATAQAQ